MGFWASAFYVAATTRLLFAFSGWQSYFNFLVKKREIVVAFFFVMRIGQCMHGGSMTTLKTFFYL